MSNDQGVHFQRKKYKLSNSEEKEFEEILGIYSSRNSKSKIPKLLFNTSIHSLPIKVVRKKSNFKQCYMRTKNVVCAVLGKPNYEGIKGHCNSKDNTTKLWRVLLDSGSDGDVLFQDRKAKNGVPYRMRFKPQLWQSSMGHFTTKK